MFKLSSMLKRYARKTTIHAEAERVAIAPYVMNDAPFVPGALHSQAIPTIAISNARETFYFEIPLDRVDRVCQQLLAAKLTIELGKRVNFDDVIVDYELKQRTPRILVSDEQRALNDQGFASLAKEAADKLRQLRSDADD